MQKKIAILFLSGAMAAMAGSAAIDPAGGETIDLSIGPVKLQKFQTFRNLKVMNFTDMTEVTDYGIELKGFQRVNKPNNSTSAPYALEANGANQTVTASIIFKKPVKAAGFAVMFATGTIQINAYDVNGDIIAAAERNGQGDPQKNGTWEDYFFGASTDNDYKPIKRIDFTRKNLNQGAIHFFTIDDLAIVPADNYGPVPMPPKRKVDFSLLNTPHRNVAPQLPAGNPKVARKGQAITFENTVDNLNVTYTLNPQKGLSSLKGSLNGQAPIALGTDWQAKLKDETASWTLTSQKLTASQAILTYDWKTSKTTIPVTITLSLNAGSLMVSFQSDKACPLTIGYPKFENVLRISDSQSTALRGPDAISFFGFGGDIFYLPQQKLFYSFQFDWTKSNASEPAPEVQYHDLGEDTATLRETFAITLSDALNKVLPSIPNPPSRYRKTIANSIIMEFWYGHFDELAELMDLYHKYGMDDMIVLMHRWQNAGFDRKLPTVMPPNPSMGGLRALRNAVREANRNGQRIALHENYKDMYPDSPQWTPEDLLIKKDGKYQNAWANAKEIAASKLQKYARPIMKDIKKQLQTTACFLDVHSTHLPWWRVDYRKGVPGRGTYGATLRPNNALWELARQNYGGPVFGECYALSSWLHAGNIDSVMGQFGHNVSLLLDFYLLKVRPLSINHGAGYYERWSPRGYVLDWQNSPLPMPEQARYSLQEVALQTAPTVDDKVKKEIPHAATQYYQKRRIVARLHDQPISNIRYYTNDGQELTSSQAVLMPKKEFQRMREDFQDGSWIMMNFSDKPWKISDGITLAPLSFRAEGKGFSAETNCVDGTYFENFLSRDAYYLNPKNYDWLMFPKGVYAMGRGLEGADPILCNRGEAVVTAGPLTTDIAVSFEREQTPSWRLRFFPQRTAGTVTIDLKDMNLKGKAQALDENGQVITENDDQVTLNGNKLTITHQDGRVWSFRVR